MFLMEKDVERIWKICGFVMEDRFKLGKMWILYVYTDIFMCVYIYIHTEHQYENIMENMEVYLV